MLKWSSTKNSNWRKGKKVLGEVRKGGCEEKGPSREFKIPEL